jgi:2-dehydro-3-deoxy-L-rhamnonate dehydrogenase (NAD+)
MRKHFENKIGIISGAASGLGRAIAQKLSEERVKLALLDINSEALAELQSQLKSESVIYPIDITSENDVKNTITEIIMKWGPIHILINSAGITGKTNIKSHETEMELELK